MAVGLQRSAKKSNVQANHPVQLTGKMLLYSRVFEWRAHTTFIGGHKDYGK